MQSALTVEERALILLDAIRNALSQGIRHYDKSGRLLTTPKEICETFMREGEVRLTES